MKLKLWGACITLKMFQAPILLLWCNGMVISNNLVKIEKTKPQIIFEPLGKLVTQFTYANIKIHGDLKPLQEEVLDTCQAALLLNQYLKDYKQQATTSTRRYLNGMQHDILQICINCIKKLNGISTTFGLKIEMESDPKKLKPILERRNKKKKDNREKRQLVTLAIVAAISIISYYTVSQLTNMAGSDNNDIITNQNHVVEAIQGEHNKLARTEKDVERLTKHLDELENHLLIMNDLDTAFIKILSIKNQCDEIANHISNIEVALYDLLKGKISPSLVSTENLSQTLNTMRNKINNEGYTLGLNEITDIIQSEYEGVSNPK